MENRVIIDIETIGIDFEQLDKKSQEYLLKFAESEEEKEEVKQRLSLYPFTGEVVAIGMLNPDTNNGAVYYQDGGKKIADFEDEGVLFRSGTEMEILSYFWESIRNYNQIITFNGRGFDAPYLHLRSAVLKIKPSRNLMSYRYDYKVHCDLLDQFTFYGAFRKFNLDFYAKSFGIKSPKEEGIDGSAVTDLFKKGKYKEIAYYCVRDLRATQELWKYWDEYLRF